MRLPAAAAARRLLAHQAERPDALRGAGGEATVHPLVEHPRGEEAQAFEVELYDGNALRRRNGTPLQADRAEQRQVARDGAGVGARGGGHVAGDGRLHGEDGAATRERGDPGVDAGQVGLEALTLPRLQDEALPPLRLHQRDKGAEASAAPFMRAHEANGGVGGGLQRGKFAHRDTRHKPGIKVDARRVSADDVVEDVDVDDGRWAEKGWRQVVPAARALDDASGGLVALEDAGDHRGTRNFAPKRLHLPAARGGVAPHSRQLGRLTGIRRNRM